MEAGHLMARHYPLGMVLDEFNILVERQNERTALEGRLLQMAFGSVMSGKKAGNAFEKIIKALTGKGQ